MTSASESIGFFERAEKVAQRIEQQFQTVPPVAMILGSGLGGLADSAESPRHLPFGEIPGLPAAGVEGHAGRLSAGTIGGVPVLLQQGRVHYYEGHPMETVVLLARGLALAGVRVLIVTNAAGAISEDLGPGDLMRITDHLNLMGSNPLIGPHDARFGERFPDMSQAYDPEVGTILDEAAAATGNVLHKGVYAAFSGPSYETPAEIRMVRSQGASAVGMSTVPETIAATQMGVRVGAVSSIANSAAGMSDSGISHKEVLEVTSRAALKLAEILKASLPRLDSLGAI
jgi:purine-nucleoside phosphorylase